MSVKGYKVFNPDWTCSPEGNTKQYSCPGRFEEDVTLRACGAGMHFCKNPADCFNYYNFDPNNRVAEVIAYGEVVEDGDKCCTNKLEIVREVPWDEVLRIVNTGKGCTGCWNTGDRNTGNCNTGNWNTGDWNASSRNSGCFNTENDQGIQMFDKPSEWTRDDWVRSQARRILNRIQKNVVEWIYAESMTDKEKAANPTYETTCGYLKVLDESECAQNWWNHLTDYERDIIKSLPNFDAAKFEKCVGVKIT